MTFKWHLQANAHLCKKLVSLESHPNYVSPHGPSTSIGSGTEPLSNSDATQQTSNVELDVLPRSEMDEQQLDEMDGGLLEEEHEEQLQNKLVDLFDSFVIT